MTHSNRVNRMLLCTHTGKMPDFTFPAVPATPLLDLHQGACNTCSSSATTMRMGIERALQITFGSQLKEVVQVGCGAVQCSHRGLGATHRSHGEAHSTQLLALLREGRMCLSSTRLLLATSVRWALAKQPL